MKFLVRLSAFLFVVNGTWALSASAEVTVEEVKQAVLKELRGNQSANSDSNVFNPAMGVVIDAVGQHTTVGEGDFNFRSAELNLQATVDPYSKAYVIINGTPDGVEVEEAAILTTRLARGVQLRGGRYFANFGRLPKFHDHELPFVNRLASLDKFFDGESKAEGLEFTYLVPTPFFLQATFGVSNKIGAENERQQADDTLLQNANHLGDSNGRRLSAFTYNARLFTYVPLGDNHGVDVGVSEAFTPKPRYFSNAYINNAANPARRLTGLDITYRYEPRANSLNRKIVWGTEIFHNSELFRGDIADVDLDGDLANESFSAQTLTRRTAWGGYSYVEATLFRQWSAGGFYDIAQNLEDRSIKTKTAGVMANYLPSEFQRIRLQVSKITDTAGSKADNQFFIQWMAIIGKHAHTFKDR